MVCRKCGYKLIKDTVICPNCGERIKEINSPIKIDITSKEEIVNTPKDNSSLLSNLFILFVIIIILFGVGYFYKVYKDKQIENTNKSEIISTFKEKGYSINDISYDVSDLEKASLINNSFEYAVGEYINNSTKLFCDQFSNEMLSFWIKEEQTVLVNETENEVFVVPNIENAKYVLSYNKSSCGCNNYNLVVLTSDGYVYVSENTKTNYKTYDEMLNDVSSSFKLLSMTTRVKNISVSTYIGNITSCHENVLILNDESNDLYIYKDGEVISSNANYASKIYNVGYKLVDNEKVNNNLFINPDRTIQIGVSYNESSPYITDTYGNKIKYYGAFSYENEDESLNMYILSTDGYLYNVDFKDNLSNITASIVKNEKISSVGYKFDLNDMKNKSLIIYKDGSYKEYEDILETYGVCSTN